jgi:prevent-host-death family protein
LGRLIDLARMEPLAVTKHGRPVIVVMAAEEFDRLQALDVRVSTRGRKMKPKG